MQKAEGHCNIQKFRRVRHIHDGSTLDGFFLFLLCINPEILRFFLRGRDAGRFNSTVAPLSDSLVSTNAGGKVGNTISASSPVS
jgi:hypothetical protein